MSKIETVEELLKEELKTRTTTEATNSEVDKIAQDIEYYAKIIKNLGKTDWEEVLVQEMSLRIRNAESNVYIKVDPLALFDLPVYTYLDMLKLQRNSLMTIEEYITWISNLFLDGKDAISNPNPYEEENEDFLAQTDVS